MLDKLFSRKKIPQQSFSWEVRVAPRAKYAKLQIKPYGGLEVVIPPRFPHSHIAALVDKHSAWIQKQLDKQATRCTAIELPRHIHLAFEESDTEVIYRDTVDSTSKKGMTEKQGRLFIKADNYQARVTQLRKWVRKKASTEFPELLQQISEQTGLSYHRVSIRTQKTRWGSCSARGTISLNDQLVFLPRIRLEYLMIHELCHTKHLNHSKKYWDLVEHHCPEYRLQEKLLNRAREEVPQWFLRDLYS